MKKRLLLYFLLILAFSGCYYDNQEDLYQNLEENTCRTDRVSYAADIAPLLTQNCASSGCHVGANGIGGLDLSTYASAAQIANNGQLINRVTGQQGNLMPPSGALPNCDIQLLQVWVAEGAPEN